MANEENKMAAVLGVTDDGHDHEIAVHFVGDFAIMQGDLDLACALKNTFAEWLQMRELLMDVKSEDIGLNDIFPVQISVDGIMLTDYDYQMVSNNVPFIVDKVVQEEEKEPDYKFSVLTGEVTEVTGDDYATKYKDILKPSYYFLTEYQYPMFDQEGIFCGLMCDKNGFVPLKDVNKLIEERQEVIRKCYPTAA